MVCSVRFCGGIFTVYGNSLMSRITVPGEYDILVVVIPPLVWQMDGVLNVLDI